MKFVSKSKLRNEKKNNNRDDNEFLHFKMFQFLLTYVKTSLNNE